MANPAYLGGAEMPQALFALTARDPGKPSMRLFGSLYLTADEVTIDRIIDRTPNEARFFAGFVVAAARAMRAVSPGSGTKTPPKRGLCRCWTESGDALTSRDLESRHRDRDRASIRNRRGGLPRGR